MHIWGGMVESLGQPPGVKVKVIQHPHLAALAPPVVVRKCA